MIDFGIYHNSTREQSEKLRGNAEQVFTVLFQRTGVDRSSHLMILDVGCGLGFLSYVAAKYFPNADILGIDTFSHESLEQSSIVKAKRNMELLGLSDRVEFKRVNILGMSETLGRFDLAISNLVFHNLGERRFDAYQRVRDILKADSFFINGDLFWNEQSFIQDNDKVKGFDLIYYVNPRLSNNSPLYYVSLYRKKT
ncbi:hypothetical protein HS7_11090 [Sulfolobales archaeon HS-7]|nr:hypothetical protein HS7_11090 [Sulfolobales archaeon HS-7]